MPNSFNAFVSDDSGDEAPKAKKTSVAPKARPAARKAPTVTRNQQPKPVQRKATNDRQSFKKPEIIEPSEVQTSQYKDRSRGNRGDRHIKPGDRDSRGKRYFDRQSGSGRGKDVKKGGGGRSNWGREGESHYNTNFSISEGAADGEGQPDKPEAEHPVIEDEEPVEPEKPTFTFDEFLKRKENERAEAGAGFEALKTVKAEDVEAKKIYTKDERKEDNFMKFGASKQEKTRKKAEKKQIVADLGFKHRNPDRERRSFRGGRGEKVGPRGGRGGYNRNRQPNRNVSTNDQQNFPQLGA